MRIKPFSINKGDRVKIVNPEFVTRVGYDNCIENVHKELLEQYGDKIEALLDLERSPYLRYKEPDRSKEAIAKAWAYEVVHKRMKDGAERKIFTETVEQPFYAYANMCCDEYVSDIKYVKTGKYFSPEYSGGGYYGDDYDYIPGGLSEEKTHKLVRICGGRWIEEKNVYNIGHENLICWYLARCNKMYEDTKKRLIGKK